MEKLSKEKDMNVKSTETKKEDVLEKSELSLLINGLDKLSKNCEKLSNYLNKAANQFDSNEINNEDLQKTLNNIISLKEATQSIIDLEKNKNISNYFISLLKKFNNEIEKEKEDELHYKNKEFLKKKRYEQKNEEDKDKEVTAKIKKYKDNNDGDVSYYIKILYLDKIYKLGPWKDLELVFNLKKNFFNKLSEYNMNENNNRKKVIDKFILKFKNKTYDKYPPLSEKIL